MEGVGAGVLQPQAGIEAFALQHHGLRKLQLSRLVVVAFVGGGRHVQWNVYPVAAFVPRAAVVAPTALRRVAPIGCGCGGAAFVLISHIQGDFVPHVHGNDFPGVDEVIGI